MSEARKAANSILPAAIISVCVPPVVLYLVCVQFFYRLFLDYIDYQTECMVVMGIFVGGFAYGLIGIFAARRSRVPATVICAMFGTAMNVLGFVASAAMYFGLFANWQ